MKLPEILNQGGKPFCSAYAIAGVANFILAARGKKDRIDPDKLYKNSTSGTGEGATLGQILAKGMLPLLGGGNVQVGTVRRILQHPQNVKAWLEMEKTPLVFTMLLPQKTFSNLIRPPDFIMENISATHSMVITSYLGNNLFEVANSFGENWKDKGYFKVPAMFLRAPWTVDIYFFNLLPS